MAANLAWELVVTDHTLLQRDAESAQTLAGPERCGHQKV